MIRRWVLTSSKIIHTHIRISKIDKKQSPRTHEQMTPPFVKTDPTEKEKHKWLSCLLNDKSLSYLGISWQFIVKFELKNAINDK